MNTKRRIEQLLQEKGWNRTDLAKKLGITPQAVQQWIRDENPTTPSAARMKALSDVSGYPVHWFSMTDDEIKNNEYVISNMSTQPDSDHHYKIELLDVKAKASDAKNGYINADYPDVIQSIYFSLDGLLEIVGRKTNDGLSMITVPTDSMSPTIEKGDVVFIDTNVDYYDGEGIYIFAAENEVYIKRLQKVPGGIYKALSDNKAYDPFEINQNIFDSIKVLGKFVRVLPINPRDL